MTRPPRMARLARTPGAAVHLLLAALAYLPVVTASPGRVGADTKTYLYLDPGELLRRATTMWDPNVGTGTVTHQTIGYLFPMGPWYWVFERLGAPDWLAQRLWLATILFAAGAGVLFLARTLGWRGAGPVVAALAYQLSPYSLDYAARISVILLPWAALPWMIGLAARALRTGGWRHPALFALVVTLVGGVNATALVLAGIGPVLWFPFAVWGTREASLRRALATVARIGALTTATSLWWISGLWAQGRYGMEILRYTETVEAVARTSTVPEILRGLGYWFFYGNDKIGPWIEPARQYTQQLWLLAVTFAVPVLALTAAVLVRWGHRAYFATLVVVGTVIAVGAHPYDDPAPLGGLFKAFASSSTVGLALRSTPRAVPLVALGLAVLLGSGVSALAVRSRRASNVAAVLAGALVAAALPPLFTGDLPVGRELDRPEEIPRYWLDAAAAIDAGGDATRVLEIPGSDFAAYRWGNTVDPITPFLVDRPYVARELIPYGSPATADLLNALDRRMQEGVFEAASLAPVARLLGAGDVVLRADLQHERYRTPRPQALWLELTDPRPPGIGRPAAFGPRTPNRPVPQFPLVDELALSMPVDAPHPPKVAVFPVVDPVPIVRARPAAGPLLVAGSGEGVVEAAAAGLLPDDRAVLYAASFADDPDALLARLDEGAHLLVTDSNRRRARRWGTVRENTGYTEQPGDRPLEPDPADARLPVFPDDAPVSTMTVADLRGVDRVTATNYGNPVSYTAEDRPVLALDGDPFTAWRVGAFADVEGETLRVDLGRPVSARRLRLLQPVTQSRNRWMTTATLRFDGRDEIEVRLDDRSRERPGQEIDLGGRRTFSRLELVVGETNIGTLPRYDGISGVGVAELGIPGVRADEVLRLPSHLLGVAGDRSAGHRLTVLVARQRSNPAEPVRTDEETHLARVFTVPTGRAFTLSGTARVSPLARDEAVDALLGLPRVARSSGRLPGSLRSRAVAAVDADPTTAWSPGLGPQTGHWVEVDLGGTRPIERLDLRVVADGRHSVPTRLRIAGNGQERVVEVPPVRDGDRAGATVVVPVRFPPLEAGQIRVTVDAVREVRTTDYYSERPIELPVAIAELGIPGFSVDVSAARLVPACRDDLVALDGVPVPVRLEGDVDAVLDRDGLRLTPCDSTALDLPAGEHELRSRPGRLSGVDVDRLVLDSAPASRPAPPPPPPTVQVVDEGRTAATVRVEDARAPFWLVLGQSVNPGWRARVEGRDLGPSTLVDGFANGWLVDPSSASFTVELEWVPQRAVTGALVASALAVLACLVLALGRRRSRRPATAERALGPPLPRRPGRAPLRLRRGAAVVVAVTAGAALAAGPVAAAAAGAVTAVGVLVPGGRRLLALGSPVALALAGAYVVVQQARYGYPPDFAWPVNFPRAHVLGWVAVALLAADVLARDGVTEGAGHRPRNPKSSSQVGPARPE